MSLFGGLNLRVSQKAGAAHQPPRGEDVPPAKASALHDGSSAAPQSGAAPSGFNFMNSVSSFANSGTGTGTPARDEPEDSVEGGNGASLVSRNSENNYDNDYDRNEDPEGLQNEISGVEDGDYLATKDKHVTSTSTSGFGFLSSSSNANSSVENVDLGEDSGAYASSETGSTAYPPSSFSFMVNNSTQNQNHSQGFEGSQASGSSVHGDHSASALASAMAASADADLLAPTAVIRVPKIKKKRSSRKPGFARYDGGSEAMSETSSLAPSHVGEDIDQEQDIDDDDNVNADGIDPIHEAMAPVEEYRDEYNPRDDDKPSSTSTAGGFSFIQQTSNSASESAIESAKGDEPTESEDARSSLTKEEPKTVQVAEKEAQQSKQSEQDDSDLGELGELLRAFRRGADQFSKGLARVNDETASTLESLERNAEESHDLAERVKALEEEQNAALAAEDFEKADKLQRTIDAVGRSVDEVDSRKLYLKRRLDELRTQKAKIFNDQVQSIDVISDLLSDCCKKESSKAKELAESTAVRAAEETRELDEQEDLLRIDMEGIESDLEVAQRELDQINTRVDAGTVDLREQRQGWEEKIAAVDDEIAELERQLAEKREERDGLVTHLDEVNSGIQAVRSKYETRLNELDDRRSHVIQKQEAAEARAQAIQTSRDIIEERKQTTEEKVAMLEQSAAEINAQLTILEKIANRLRQSHDGLDTNGDGDDNEADEAAVAANKMRKMEDDVHVARQNIDFNSRKAQELEQQLTDLGRRQFDIDSKLPALNEQKRLAVSSRNFKEAGRLNTVIKEVTAEKEAVEAEIDEIKSKSNEIREQIESKAEMVKELVEAIKGMQDSVNRATLSSLNAKRLSLRSTQAEVRLSGSVEPNTFGETVLFILEAEASACEEEAKAISVKICGDESLAVLPSEEDIGEVQLHQKDQDATSADEGSAVDGDENHATDDARTGSADEDAAVDSVNGEKDVVRKSDDGEMDDDEGLVSKGSDTADDAEQRGVEGVEEEQEVEEEADEEENMTLEELQAAIDVLDADIANAVDEEDFETAAALEEEASPLRDRLERLIAASAAASS